MAHSYAGRGCTIVPHGNATATDAASASCRPHMPVMPNIHGANAAGAVYAAQQRPTGDAIGDPLYAPASPAVNCLQ